MNNVIQLPVIAGVEITTDEQERFNLNALHKASGLGKNKAPNKWLENKQAKALVLELESQTPNSGSALKVINGGKGSGTFAVEQLAVAYANWISPAFYLTVINTFLEHKKGVLRPEIPQSLPEALRYAAELAEENSTLKPKAEALDRISTSDGSLCITDAAKALQMRPKDLFQWLDAHDWIYRRAGCGHWIGHSEKLKQGCIEHKVTVVSRTDGSEKTTEQVRVTPKGLTKLSENLCITKAA